MTNKREWLAYPENKPTEEKFYLVEVKFPSGKIVASGSRWLPELDRWESMSEMVIAWQEEIYD